MRIVPVFFIVMPFSLSFFHFHGYICQYFPPFLNCILFFLYFFILFIFFHFHFFLFQPLLSVFLSSHSTIKFGHLSFIFGSILYIDWFLLMLLSGKLKFSIGLFSFKHFGRVLSSAPVIMDTLFMFHIFFSSLARSRSF